MERKMHVEVPLENLNHLEVETSRWCHSRWGHGQQLVDTISGLGAAWHGPGQALVNCQCSCHDFWNTMTNVTPLSRVVTCLRKLLYR